jgi:hypothetical protein
MILTQHATGSDVTTCAVNEVERPAIVINGSSLDFDQPIEVNWHRRFLACGGQHISLHNDLVAEAYLNAGVLRIRGWSIEFDLYGQADLDRALLRKFLDLFSKAEANRLCADEQEQWASIVNQVDYQRFCAERSPHIYLEGSLVSRTPDGWVVRWHDGTEQRIGCTAGRALELLDPGQRFGAMVKFGKDQTVQSIADISLVPESAATSEELWQSWPPVSS